LDVMTDAEGDVDGDAPLPVFPGFREVAERLSARRQALGLSQTAVAARMGTSQSAVARLESGAADVRLSTLHRYAEALGGTLAVELLAGDRRRDAP
jgi:transcriptional regulator with XRE-family HTH domain